MSTVRRSASSGFVAVLLAAIGALSADAGPQQGTGDPPQAPVVRATPTKTSEQAVSPADPDYRIGVEDLLAISVWRDPDLTREVPVRPDGKISLPLLQDVQAAGQTPQELGQEIQRRLREFMSNPSVTVIVREINSQKIYLVGEVVKPGSVILRSRTTLLQAIALGGGVTPFGGRSVVIYRTTPGWKSLIEISYRDLISGKKPEQNVYLQPGDTIVVR